MGVFLPSGLGSNHCQHDLFQHRMAFLTCEGSREVSITLTRSTRVESLSLHRLLGPRRFNRA